MKKALKFLSIILCLAMVFTTLPILPAFAQENSKNLIEYPNFTLKDNGGILGWSFNSNNSQDSYAVETDADGCNVIVIDKVSRDNNFTLNTSSITKLSADKFYKLSVWIKMDKNSLGNYSYASWAIGTLGLKEGTSKRYGITEIFPTAALKGVWKEYSIIISGEDFYTSEKSYTDLSLYSYGLECKYYIKNPSITEYNPDVVEEVAKIETPNMISNGDFSNYSETDGFAGWIVDGNTAARNAVVNVGQSSDVPQNSTSTSSAKITVKNQNDEAYFMNAFGKTSTLSTSKNYRFSMWVKITNPDANYTTNSFDNDGRIRLAFRGSNGNDTKFGTKFTAKDQWTKLSFILTGEELAAMKRWANYDVSICLNIYGMCCDIYVADARVEEVIGNVSAVNAENILTNGDFEIYDETANSFSSWTLNGAWQSSISMGCAEGITGNALKYTATNIAHTGGITGNAVIDPKYDYKVVFYAKTENSDTVKFSNPTNSWNQLYFQATAGTVSVTSAEILYKTDWQKFELIVADIPENTTTMEIKMVAQQIKGIILLDDISVTPILGGSISANRENAKAGDIVYVTVNPDAGKKLVANGLTYLANGATESVAITEKKSDVYTLYKGDDGVERKVYTSLASRSYDVYQFVMPENADVVISAVFEDRFSAPYSPVKAERYYAENVAVPKTISVQIKTNEKIFGGAIVSSEDYTLDIANKGYPRVTLKDGDEIVFPVDVRSDALNHIAVSCNDDAGEWYLYLNGEKVSTVSGTAISENTIEKLYIGASADKYNNNYFKGAIADLAVYSEMLTDSEVSDLISGVNTASDSLLAYWNLNGDDKTDGSVNGKTLTSETVLAVTEQPESGITFSSRADRLESYEVYDSAVNTFETWLKTNSNYSLSPQGCIFSSYYARDNSNKLDYLQISLTSAGNPLLEIRSGGVKESFTFDVDVNTGNWLHLAISADYENGVYNCYINGQFADSVAVGTLQIPVSHRAYFVSGCGIGTSSTVYFNGALAGMKIYSDSRTAEEIYEDVYSTDINDSGLMAYWKMQDKAEGLKDLKGTNDLHLFFTDTADEVPDESFGNYSTFVFISDTQYLTEGKGEAGLSKITDWILNNKESENIVGVMGVGDITENNTASQWAAAANAFEPLKGQVPFVFVSGNHDMERFNPSPDNLRDVSLFNEYFPYADWQPYMTGFFEEGKIDNMYYLLEDVNGEKYMLLGLEYCPREAVLNWANELVEEYSDYKVIVATHSYQAENIVNGKSSYTSFSGDSIIGTDGNGGKQIWEKFASQHENIQAVVCGHCDSEIVIYSTNTGVNGNTVAEFLVDAQQIERYIGSLGAIMILRVSEDGTKANVNYYSTYMDKYIKDLSQYNIDWIGSYIAEADGIKYNTLEDAISAVSVGGTVKLLNNITVTDAIKVSKNFKIDIAGYTITNNSTAPLFDIADDMGMCIVNGVYTYALSKIIADINSDGDVSASDLTYLKRKILGNITDMNYYDVNGDGIYNILDIIRAKKIAAQ